MVDVGRRRFMSGAGLAAAGVAVSSITPSPTQAATAAARVDYPINRLANIKDLKLNEPLNVSYPDANAPGVLLKLGTKVPGGVGAEGDIVASRRSARTRASRSISALPIGL
jgi:arsenite oxidase small subunit